MTTKALPRDFLRCPKEDLLVLISRMLVSLVSINDSYSQNTKSTDSPGRESISSKNDTTLTRFHSRAPPSISIFDYLLRLSHYNLLENAILIISVYYIDLLSNNYSKFNLNSLTVHRFLLTSTTVAAKGLCDSFCTNNHYAKVGGVNLNELNFLEMEFLQKINWRVIPRYEDDLDANENPNLNEIEYEKPVNNNILNNISLPDNEETNSNEQRSFLSGNPAEVNTSNNDNNNDSKLSSNSSQKNNSVVYTQKDNNYINTRKKKLLDTNNYDYDYDDEDYNKMNRRTKRHHSQGDISKKLTSNSSIRTNINYDSSMNESFFAHVNSDNSIPRHSNNRHTVSEALSPTEPEFCTNEDVENLNSFDKQIELSACEKLQIPNSVDSKITSNSTSNGKSVPEVSASVTSTITKSSSGNNNVNNSVLTRLRHLSVTPKYIGIAYSHEILDNYYKKMIDLVGAETGVFLGSSHCSNPRLVYSLVPE